MRVRARVRVRVRVRVGVGGAGAGAGEREGAPVRVRARARVGVRVRVGPHLIAWVIEPSGPRSARPGPVMASCVALTSAMISKTIASTVIDAHAPWREGKGGRSYGHGRDAAMALPSRAYNPEGSHS